MTPEGKVKAEVRKILRDHAAYVHYEHIPASQFGKAGAADYLACICGRFVSIECKAGKGKQTLLQQVNQKLVEGSGGIYLLINETNYDKLKNLINLIRTRDNYNI